jgi:casein kinase 1
MLADQMVSATCMSLAAAYLLSQISRVEFVHSRDLVYRDLKPDNFAVGFGKLSSLIHLFDFGLTKLYVNPHAREHTSIRHGRAGLGTPRYASVNVHLGLGEKTVLTP